METECELAKCDGAPAAGRRTWRHAASRGNEAASLPPLHSTRAQIKTGNHAAELLTSDSLPPNRSARSPPISCSLLHFAPIFAATAVNRPSCSCERRPSFADLLLRLLRTLNAQALWSATWAGLCAISSSFRPPISARPVDAMYDLAPLLNALVSHRSDRAHLEHLHAGRKCSRPVQAHLRALHSLGFRFGPSPRRSPSVRPVQPLWT